MTAYQPPALDIMTYYPMRSRMSEIDAASNALFHAAADCDPSEQIHLATYTVKGSDLAKRGHEVEQDAATARIMRSTVMKPENEAYIPAIHARLCELSRQ